jgi:hypothetical protein
LLVLGAVLWAASRDAKAAGGESMAPFVAAAFATFVVVVQQKAIWSGMAGAVYVGLMGALTFAWGAGFVRSWRRRPLPSASLS